MMVAAFTQILESTRALLFVAAPASLECTPVRRFEPGGQLKRLLFNILAPAWGGGGRGGSHKLVILQLGESQLYC